MGRWILAILWKVTLVERVEIPDVHALERYKLAHLFVWIRVADIMTYLTEQRPQQVPKQGVVRNWTSFSFFNVDNGDISKANCDISMASLGELWVLWETDYIQTLAGPWRARVCMKSAASQAITIHAFKNKLRIIIHETRFVRDDRFTRLAWRLFQFHCLCVKAESPSFHCR